jgi:hypothetical protein
VDYAFAFRLTYVLMVATLVAWQAMGGGTLHLHYYASYLIPALFLAIGADFHGALWKLSPVHFGCVVGCAALLPVLPLIAPIRSSFLPLQTGESLLPFALFGLAGAILFLGRANLAAFLVVIAVWTAANIAVLDHRVINLAANRPDKISEFQAVTDTARVVRAVAPAGFARFWYDGQSPRKYVFEAAATTHLAGFQSIERNVSTLSKPDLLRGASVALLTDTPEADLAATRALQAVGLTSAVRARVPIQHGDIAFTVTVLEVQAAAAASQYSAR